MAVPYTFGTATAAIPLSQLDNNFATTITLGNTAIQLGNTVTTLNNMTLANVTISSGNVTITNVSVTNISATLANVTTANVTNFISGNVSITGGTIDNVTIGGTTVGNVSANNVTISNNLTLSGGTANGVTYLNGSKVLTSGSALTFDGTTFTSGAHTLSTGNLNFGTTGQRITGDFSNATRSSRVSFQSSTTNGATVVQLIPNGTSTSTQVAIYNATDLDNTSVVQLTNNGTDARIASGIFGTGTYLPMTFFTGGSERMRLDTSGNVGIGTSSPSSFGKLAVTASSGVIGNFESTQSATNANVLNLNATQTNSSAGIRFQVNSGTTAQARIQCNGDSTIVFQNTSSDTERMRITSAGEVYIAGTTDQGAYNLQCNGTGVWGAGAYVNGSDERLKENIANIESGLDVVSAMRPVTFTYKEDYSKDQNIQTGFIAQELQQAMSGKNYVDGIVQSGPEYLNVAYQSLIPILTKAIQEQQALIQDLTTRLAALEAK